MEADDTKKEDSAVEMSENSHAFGSGEFIEHSAGGIQGAGVEGNNIKSFSTMTLHVKYPDLFLPWEAKLLVEYFWNPSGTLFSCQAKRYAATDNGRRKGNVYLSFSSAGSWSERELTNDNAIQDGYWHEVSGGGYIAGNKHSADVNFKFTYDHEFSSDKSKSISVTMRFEVDFRSPMITNPKVVHTPLPRISGKGYPDALVKLYEYDQRDLVIGTAPVDEDGNWTATLTKPLSMTESYSMTALQVYEGVPSRWAVYTNFAALFAPQIVGVIVYPHRKVSVSGEGGLKNATLEIWLEDKNKGVQLTTTVWQDGNWSVSSGEAWPPGKHLITAKQVGPVSGQSSAWSDIKVVSVKPPTLQIESPPHYSSVKQVLKINGVWPEKATVQIFTEKDEPVAGSFNSSTHTFTPSGAWAVGSTKVKAVQTVGDVASDSSSLVAVIVRPSSAIIERPPVPTTPTQTLSIKSVSLDATLLEMFNEVDAKVAGEFTGSGTTRVFTPAQDWSVSTQVKIVQTVCGIPSNPSELVPIVVKLFIAPPPDPAAVKEVLAISFSSSGHNDLRMYTQAGGPVAGSFTDSVPVRYFTPTAAWKAGKTTVKVVQTVGNVANTSNLVTVAVQPFKLSIAQPPSYVSSIYALILLDGSSAPGTLQMLTEAGATVTGEFSTGTLCRFTPSPPWPAGNNAVMAVQSVDDVSSDPSNVVTFLVRPSQPEIDQPPKPAVPRQRLNITGVVPGAVALQMFTEDGAAVEGDFTGVDASRTFTPTADWAGTQKIKVVQTIDGAASSPSVLVTVYAPPQKPEIEQPPIPAEPYQVLTIKNVARGIVTLRMLTEAGTSVDGEFRSSGNNTATFTRKFSWASGKTSVKVIQSVSGVSSESSDVVCVVKRPYKPVIRQPLNPVTSKQPLTITGVAGGDVTLQMLTEDGETVPGYFAGSDGLRTFTPTMDWSGTTKVKVVQAVDDVPSDPSDLVTVVVAAKLPKPEITHPLPKTSHLANVRVEGTCVAGATVFVQFDSGEPVPGTVTYDATLWFFEFPWQPGQQLIKAQQSVNGETSEATDRLEFYIKPPKPAIAAPPAPVALKQPLNITEVASGAVTLKMLTDNDEPVAGDFTSSGAERTFTPSAEWGAGENTVKVVQTVNSVDSNASDTCTFTVDAADRPDPPRFQQPQAGSGTSRYPTIQVVGLPDARLTVRLVGGETLCEDTANADGILEFMVVNPLVPGTNELQGKQISNGLNSDWSTPHAFTVYAPPATPVIRVPGANGNALRRPRIQGSGETGGQIVLRHVADPEPPFAFIDGSLTWRWNAEEEWEVDTYEIQAQQIVDGDCSEWTQPHGFQVVESLYGIGDAIPVLGTPVVGTGQSVVLRVQVISADNGQAIEGVKVQWRLKDELEPLTETTTDLKGWTQYAYTPDTIGKREILADITQANEGVVMTETYEVNAVQQDEWAQEAELYLDGQQVDLTKSDLVLLKGRDVAYKLEIKVNKGSVLIGSRVTLQDLWGAAERGLTFFPDLEMPQEIKEGQSAHWYIFTDNGNGGIFGLNLTTPVLPDWQIPGRIEAGDFAELIDVDLDTVAQVFGGEPAYPCLGVTHTITVRPKLHSPLLGQNVTLELTQEAADLGVTVSPATPQTVGDDGVHWSLNCVDSSKNGSFAARLKVQEWDFTSLEMPMSLGHNKVYILEKYGPVEVQGQPNYWWYGVRLRSSFTKHDASGVEVSVEISGKQPEKQYTREDGWLLIKYDLEQSANLTILNRYDGSTPQGPANR
ncbi:hypothetical protein [Pseudomonas sp. NPDC087614]|uniref:hypothetical protein n=1 Tax=Pseudomonas sp. NPDC087614 TaxID=3364442 RepID=UPI00381DCAA9